MANQRYEANESAIDKAKRLGTYGKIDRSAQYENELDGLDSVQLRRKLQAKYDELFKKTRDLEQVKFWHRAALMFTTAFLANAPAILGFLGKLFR